MGFGTGFFAAALAVRNLANFFEGGGHRPPRFFGVAKKAHPTFRLRLPQARQRRGPSPLAATGRHTTGSRGVVGSAENRPLSEAQDLSQVGGGLRTYCTTS